MGGERFRCLQVLFQPSLIDKEALGIHDEISQYRFTWKLKFKFEFWFLGNFWAQVGPKTPLIGAGSENCAERTQNQSRGLIIMSFRDSFVVHS